MDHEQAPLRTRPRRWRFSSAYGLFLVVLVLIFVLIGVMKRGGAGAEAQHARSTYLWPIMAILFVGSFAYFSWVARRAKRFYVANSAAVELLKRGELEAAHQRFDMLMRERGVPEELQRVARFNLAWTQLLLEQIEDAHTNLMQVETERRSRPAVALDGIISTRLAYVHALSGELTEARRWLELSRARAEEPVADATSMRAWLVTTQAIVDCRGGDPGRALSELDARWLELENSLTGELLRPLRVLRAFARQSAEPGGDSSVIDAQLQVLRGLPTRELAHLGTRWPQMRAFLAQQRLAHDAPLAAPWRAPGA